MIIMKFQKLYSRLIIKTVVIWLSIIIIGTLVTNMMFEFKEPVTAIKCIVLGVFAFLISRKVYMIGYEDIVAKIKRYKKNESR